MIYSETGNGSSIALVYDDTEYAQANARLIAAAPELLAACRHSLEWLDLAIANEPEDYRNPELSETIQQLRAAIAKATEGGQ